MSQSVAGAADWYYALNNIQKGPFSREQISALVQAGSIDAATLVWAAGAPGWTPLSHSPLRDLLPPQPAYPPPLNTPASPAHAPPAYATVTGQTIGFGDAIGICFRKYVTFSGRASRPEYWYFMLFCFLASLAAMIVDVMVLGSLLGDTGALQLIFNLATFLPSLAALVRRLHDTDRSAHWLWIILIPILGAIVLLVFVCQKSTPGRNRFG